jgi:hypothetical protein
MPLVVGRFIDLLLSVKVNARIDTQSILYMLAKVLNLMDRYVQIPSIGALCVTFSGVG